ncbi:MAG: Asp-tRNA(Asn)/Glu-tRNA(Gln) amidotransferase subunit GatB [Proteobacteria bacterium]|nr:Asp-tRNA(Asn)/Glu-tRNA(Gln) amidotransferase subunit GatB [Pseudomonadota bacterium]
MAYEPVIGLEVHCQLATASKLFCGCATKFGAEPNHQVCPICLGMPGVLPVLNRTAVDLAVKMALAIGGSVQQVSVFSRKQYFYPDLPKGYQITQYDRPYCLGGGVTLSSGQRIRMTRIHLEEDAGKNIHAEHASLVDCNRAGTPLMEIVSEPELKSAADAAEYLRRLRAIVRCIGASDGNLEEGSFRCDANVSIRRPGATVLGTRCEIKNLNSFRNVERAITYEILRQAEVLDGGGTITQETLLFDANSGRTQPMRSKEDSHDYRYLPDPDLPALVISMDRIEGIRASLPELPDAAKARLVQACGLADANAELIAQDQGTTRFFDLTCEAVGASYPAPAVANWLIAEYLPVAEERQWNLAESPIPPQRVAALLQLIAAGTISGKIAKTVFDVMLGSDEAPTSIVQRLGLVQISDEGAITELVERILTHNPGQLAQYLGGKDKLFGFFIGQIMQASQGKMNPELVNKILHARLAERRGRLD